MSNKYSGWDFDGYDLIDNLPVEKSDDAISRAEYRWIELKGYMSSVGDLPRFGIRKGWRCMNCYSMVYYDKCPNDECYNFYHYIGGKKDKFMESKVWERLDELGITKEK